MEKGQGIDRGYIHEPVLPAVEPGEAYESRYVGRPGNMMSPVTMAGEVVRWLKIQQTPDTTVVYQTDY
mgnify:CR=1 FL=1